MSMVAFEMSEAALPRAGTRWEGVQGRGDGWEEEGGDRRSWEEEKRWRAASQWRNLAMVTLSDSSLYTGSASSWYPCTTEINMWGCTSYQCV